MILGMEEGARGVSKEIYCRDKRVQRKMRVKADSVASGNAGSDARYSDYKIFRTEAKSLLLSSADLLPSVYFLF
ncbi:unnamed protein product [Lasius platythorax]|uniref:Uncharacterized protein n=1 Tax=Lasius platythorax TaxID=488582 RepID=A0AAV2NR62_9HYME